MLCVPNRADLFNSAQIPGGGGKREVSEQEVPEQEVPEQEVPEQDDPRVLPDPLVVPGETVSDYRRDC
jgi:hypothetical protein